MKMEVIFYTKTQTVVIITHEIIGILKCRTEEMCIA